MKSYGKVDETWEDERLRGLIDEIREMAIKSKKSCAIGQDKGGNVVVTGDGPDKGCMYVCWTHPPKNSAPQDGERVFVDNSQERSYTAGQMVPRIRNALTRGIIDHGGLRFLSEGRIHLMSVFGRTRRMVRLYGEPFIMGEIDAKIKTAPRSERDYSAGITPDMSKSIVTAPLSERMHFVDYASCVVTKNGCWSLLDRIPDSAAYREYDITRRIRDLKNTHVSDRRSIYIGMPPMFVYDTILEHGKNTRRSRPTKGASYRMKQAPQKSQSKIPARHDWFEKSKQVGTAGQEQRISEHAIAYFKQDGDTSVKDESIDFPKAKSEIELLGHGKDNHFIGFKNNNTREMVQFAHYEPDGWYADVPIPPTGDWSGYVWGCRTDTESVIRVVKLFIDEASWFNTIPFTMRKHGKAS